MRIFLPNILFSALSCLAVVLAGQRRGNLIQQAPAKALALINPYQRDPRARRAGSKLYERECASCHGPNAQGCGKAPALDQPRVFEAPPGALFWVLRNGSLRRGMPSFAHLPEAQRWQIVTYIGNLR